MNDTLGPNKWRNPFAVQNAGADYTSRALTLGAELRRKVAAGLALGTFVIESPVPATLNTIAIAEFDFVIIDMEHSGVDFSKLETLIAASQAAGLPTLVRPWGADMGLIGKILDIGANGIMAPHVDSAEHAAAIVEQARFPPTGKRGFSPLTKYDSLAEPIRELDDSTYVVVQIEGQQGVKDAPDIAAVRGIDAVFVGPYDLALSMGVAPGSASVFAVAKQLIESMARDVGKGIYIDDPATCGDWATLGFALQCVSFDGRMLANGARTAMRQAKVGLKHQDKKA